MVDETKKPDSPTTSRRQPERATPQTPPKKVEGPTAHEASSHHLDPDREDVNPNRDSQDDEEYYEDAEGSWGELRPPSDS